MSENSLGIIEGECFNDAAGYTWLSLKGMDKGEHRISNIRKFQDMLGSVEAATDYKEKKKAAQELKVFVGEMEQYAEGLER